MNKTQRKQAGDYLRLLEKAHNEVRKAVETKKYDVAMDLLEQCQDAAIELGNRIEAAEGEGFVTIPLLENYCELTYQIHEEIWQKHFASAGKVYKSLRKSLIQIENSVKNDIKVRTEAVFLPYKASMWDSLESVWKAADEDPGCDAYVIPIPYYDKNPDGSFREMHYEGKEYPDYVPVTWYEDYDFASRQPDMIFIHNPYDNYNYVTSVHPFFYSENLKQYTEKLVYIPYFILGEVDPDNDQAVEGVAHFVTCPGVMNADKVIVQSEAMRQVYIKVLTKLAGEGTKRYWEERVLGLGSPKIDKVLNTKREDLEVPEEWLKVIQKPDGSWKKIIFYNTSVSALLQNGEKMLRKMEDVFRVFKENQDEVALLWRPHPLIKATIESMRPELWEEYEKIVEKYCSDGWGIYDDSADLDRAIEVSDAYYGDRSSVEQLYKEAQKPIMIQNALVKAKKIITVEDIPIWPSAFYVDGNDVWFVHGKMNILMRYNINEDYTYIADKIPEEPFFKENSFRGIYKWKNKIFLIPCWAREIAIYDTLNKKFAKISLQHIGKYYQKILFCKAYAFDNYLYCIPYCYEAIIKINMDSLELQYIDITKVLGIQEKIYINDAIKIEDEVAAVIPDTDKILLFDLKTDNLRIFSEESGRQYTHLTGLNDEFYIYDKKENVITKRHKDFTGKEKNVISVIFKNVILSNFGSRYILLDSNYDGRMMVIDEEGTIIYQNDTKDILKKSLDYTYYEGVISEQNEISGTYYFNMSDNKLYEFDNGRVNHQFKFFLTSNELQKIKLLLENQMQTECIENELYNIDMWTKQINKFTVRYRKEHRCCGELIIDLVKEPL